MVSSLMAFSCALSRDTSDRARPCQAGGCSLHGVLVPSRLRTCCTVLVSVCRYVCGYPRSSVHGISAGCVAGRALRCDVRPVFVLRGLGSPSGALDLLDATMRSVSYDVPCSSI